MQAQARQSGKRARALQACDVCRTRKQRCNEDCPCAYCDERGLECTYLRALPEKRMKTLPAAAVSHQRGPQISGHNTVDMSTFNGNRLDHAREDASDGVQSIGLEPLQQHSNQTRPSSADQAPQAYPSSSEVMDINKHTNNMEFYGSASCVAFLRHVQQRSDRALEASDPSLPSLLHNTEFGPNIARNLPPAIQESDVTGGRLYFRAAKKYLDAYFTNIHLIQPVFDQEEFLSRCEDLWLQRHAMLPLSFLALYYATLSLGCLVMPADETDEFSPDRFPTSRRLFRDALAILNRLGTATDLEMVQCFYMMAKVCQHQLDPHTAYLYSGQAARIALAIGINRRPVGQNAADPRTSLGACQTWWAVYCLDIQNSFALGRPDSLGSDGYHTQSIPGTRSDADSTKHVVLQIVPCMIDLSRMMRRVAIDIYAQPGDVRLLRAQAFDAELEDWYSRLPAHLQHTQITLATKDSLKPRRLTTYSDKQSLVLRLRYLNLRMVLHAVSINETDTPWQEEAILLRESRCHCIQAAEETIDIIHETFRTRDYFQTWWYNATYILFAVSALLGVVFRQLARTNSALDNLFAHIEKAIAILEAVDDIVVTRKAVTVVKRALARARKIPQPFLVDPSSNLIIERDAGELEQQSHSGGMPSNTQTDATLGDSLENDIFDFDWPREVTDGDSAVASFWTEWAYGLDFLGNQI